MSAALVFVAAITLHMLRIIFHGAFRKPRDINFFIGLTLMIGWRFSRGSPVTRFRMICSPGWGSAIGWGVAMSLPLIGGPGRVRTGGQAFPASTTNSERGSTSRMSSSIPALLAGSDCRPSGDHRDLKRHSQFRGPGRREDNVVGTPMWPGYALRSLGLFAAVGAVLVLMGGLIQINPIWLWGQYHPYIGTNGAQPDWYLGWLIGALRRCRRGDQRVRDTRSCRTRSSEGSCSQGSLHAALRPAVA